MVVLLQECYTLTHPNIWRFLASESTARVCWLSAACSSTSMPSRRVRYSSTSSVIRVKKTVSACPGLRAASDFCKCVRVGGGQSGSTAALE